MGLNTLAGDLRAEVMASISEAQTTLAEIEGDRKEFQAKAGPFKADFGAVLLTLEQMADEISLITGLRFSLEFAKERELLNKLPNRAVAPLYRAVAGGDRIDFAELKHQLNRAVQDLAVLRSAIQEDRPVTAAPRPVRRARAPEIPDGCGWVLEHATLVRVASLGVWTTGKSLKIVAGGIDSAGETNVEKHVQIHGYIGFSIQTNKPKTIAIVLKHVSDIMQDAQAFAMNKLDQCTLEYGQIRILEAISNIALDVGLDAPISSRASQVSVDGIALTLGRLEPSVFTRASQASVDSVLHQMGNVASNDALMVRIQIERELSSQAPPPAVFYFPEAYGGMLEKVRTIVAEAIDQARLAGFELAAAARRLAGGDEAFAAGDYKRAYQRYSSAYRSL